jgi:hypothetical protein
VGRQGDDAALGRSRFGELSRSDLDEARTDLFLLRSFGLGSQTGDVAFQQLYQQEGNPEFAYALLSQEAREADIAVSEADEDELLLQHGISVENLGEELSRRLSNQPGVSTGRLREALANWVRIRRCFYGSLSAAPPSHTQLVRTAQAQLERVALEGVRLSAEDFLEQVGEPAPQAVEAHFQQYRELPAGQGSPENPFGFGFRVPNQVRVTALVLDEALLARGMTVSDDEVLNYFQKHQEDYLDEQGQTKQVIEAFDEVAQTLRNEKAMEYADALLDRAGRLIVQYSQQAQPTTAATQPDETAVAPPYRLALDQLKIPAAQLSAHLQKTVRPEFESVALADALDQLARQAGLEAIVVPAQRGNDSLDPNVRVSLSGERTLQAALDAVFEQARWPVPAWASLAGMDRVLFSDAEGDFPLRLRDSGLVGPVELVQDPIFGAAVAGEQPLANLAVYNAVFIPEDRRPEDMTFMQVGQDGPLMHVQGSDLALLWRLIAAVPAHAPEQFTDELAARAAEDLRQQAAFELAYQAAQALNTGGKLQQALDANQYPAFRTAMFTRNSAMQQPTEGLEFVPRNQMLEIVRTAFSPALLPEDIQGEIPAKSRSVAVQRLPALREVLVFRRSGYKPLYRDEIQQQWQRLFQTEMYRQLLLSARMWFNLNEIVNRTKFKRENAA